MEIPGPPALEKEIAGGVSHNPPTIHDPLLSGAQVARWTTPAFCLDLFAAIRNCLTR